MTANQLQHLLAQIAQCEICSAELKDGVRPVLQVARSSAILIAGQAPGRRVHESGIPFDDPSGERLRSWLGLSAHEFYDERLVGILPMGFCYPGSGKSGDLPPRPECAAAWRQPVLDELPELQLQVIIGRHALAWHRPDLAKLNLDVAIRHCLNEAARDIVLPHPSPRNNLWLKRHPWFEEEVVPLLQARVAAIKATR